MAIGNTIKSVLHTFDAKYESRTSDGRISYAVPGIRERVRITPADSYYDSDEWEFVGVHGTSPSELFSLIEEQVSTASSRKFIAGLKKVYNKLDVWNERITRMADMVDSYVRSDASPGLFSPGHGSSHTGYVTYEVADEPIWVKLAVDTESGTVKLYDSSVWGKRFTGWSSMNRYFSSRV